MKMKKIKERLYNETLTVSIIALILGLITGGILIFLIGENPFDAYAKLFKGGLSGIKRIGNTFATATPLILTGLGAAFGFRTGLFNIGLGGQMLIGGVVATTVALKVNAPKAVVVPLAVLLALIAGALWAIIPGFFKARFNVHEVVSTIMMNWIAYWSVYYYVPAYLKGEYLETESRTIPQNASLKVEWLTKLFKNSYINIGIFIAIAAVIIIAFILDRTTLGFELKTVGFNRHAAEYGGINVNRSIIIVMAISGALAGLAGATLYIGNASNLQIGVLPSQGFDGIAVALLGANSPWGVFASALFFGILYSGKGFMSGATHVPPEIADTIIAVIIYFAATSVLIKNIIEKIKKTFKGKSMGKAKNYEIPQTGEGAGV